MNSGTKLRSSSGFDSRSVIRSACFLGLLGRRAWELLVRNRLAIAIASLAWLILRSGSQPRRLSYPCQRVAVVNVGAILAGLVPAFFLARSPDSRHRIARSIVVKRQLIAAGLMFLVALVGIEGYQYAQSLVPPQLPDVPPRLTGSDLVNVGVAQQDLVEGETLTMNQVRALVRKAIERAGGLEGIIAPGDTVLLKPNLVYSVADGTQGVNTDPRVCAAIIEMVKGITNGQVMIAEGTATGAGEDSTRQAMIRSGYDTNDDKRFDYDTSVTLHDLNDSGGLHQTNPAYVTSVLIDNGVIREQYWVPNIVLDADVMICVPTLKNHGNTQVTLSLKNRIGCAPNDIYHSAGGHVGGWGNGTDGKEALVHWTDEGFPCTVPPEPPTVNECVSRTLVDLNLVRPQDFAVVDGLNGVTNGPASWPPARPSPLMRLIVAGSDSLAVDTVCTTMMGYNPDYVSHFAWAHSTGALGTKDLSIIRPIGTHPVLARYNFPENYNNAGAVRSDSNPPSITNTSITEGGDVIHESPITGWGINDNIGVVQASLFFDKMGPNLLANGDFENGDDGSWTRWRTGSGTGEVWDFDNTDAGHVGTRCLKLGSASTHSSFGVYQQVAVQPGKTYRVDAYWRGQKLGTSNWFEILLIDGPYTLDEADTPGIVQDNFMYAYDPGTYNLPGAIGTTFGWIWAHEQNAPPKNQVDWHERLGRRTASGNVMTVVLKGGTDGTGVAVWFDEVRFTEVQGEYVVGTTPHPSDPFSIEVDASALPTGTHQGEARLTVYDSALNEDSIYANVTLMTCPQDPWVCIDQGLYAHTIYVGSDIDTPDVLGVSNCGCLNGDLNYTITDDADWLEVDPAYGTSPEGAPTSTLHDIVYDTTELLPGLHTATITVTGPANSRDIIVNVEVETVRPDLDRDGDVDLDDFGELQACLGPTGVKPAPGCERCDLDGTDDVSQGDVTKLRGCLAGANIIPSETCDD